MSRTAAFAYFYMCQVPAIGGRDDVYGVHLMQYTVRETRSSTRVSEEAESEDIRVSNKKQRTNGSDQMHGIDTDAKWHPAIQNFLKELEAAPASGPYLQAPHDSSRRQAFNQISATKIRSKWTPRAQFLVYSDSSFYDSRLTWVRDTWASDMPSDAVHAIGDEPAPDGFGLRVSGTRCPKHSHWEGACCKYAEAVIQAHDAMLEDENIKWAYFTDDDSYVRGAALEAKLLAMDTGGDAGKGVMFAGALGCAPQKATTCSAGMCAGGGYAASREAVQLLVGGRPADFLREQMASCSACERWADLALSQVARHRGINMLTLEGLYGWRLNEQKFKDSLAGNPLLYHYIHTQDEMNFLHSLFGNSTSPTDSLSGAQGEKCVNFKEKRHCASVGFPWDAAV